MAYAASAIILKDKKILLVKRSDSDRVFPGAWACPGGKGDDGETPKETVVREVKEETNIDFRPTRLFKTWRLQQQGPV